MTSSRPSTADPRRRWSDELSRGRCGGHDPAGPFAGGRAVEVASPTCHRRGRPWRRRIARATEATTTGTASADRVATTVIVATTPRTTVSMIPARAESSPSELMAMSFRTWLVAAAVPRLEARVRPALDGPKTTLNCGVRTPHPPGSSEPRRWSGRRNRYIGFRRPDRLTTGRHRLLRRHPPGARGRSRGWSDAPERRRPRLQQSPHTSQRTSQDSSTTDTPPAGRRSPTGRSRCREHPSGLRPPLPPDQAPSVVGEWQPGTAQSSTGRPAV